MGIDPVELGKWERGETERYRLVRTLCGIWHNVLPKFLGFKLTPPRLAFGFLRFISFIAVALLPIWIKIVDGSSSLSWEQAAALSVITVAFLGYNYFYDKNSRDAKTRGVREQLVRKLCLELAGVIAALGRLVKVPRKEHVPAIDTARKQILGCLRDVARIHLADYEGTCIEATVWVFDDAECNRMRVCDRTTTARPTGKVAESQDVMAFYVAKSGKHRVIHDFRRDHPFPKTGVSGPDPPYRSILLIPLLDTSTGSPDTCVGAVTIDSTRPYHFWPGNGEELVVKFSPYTAWLVSLLNLTGAHKLRLRRAEQKGSDHGDRNPAA